MKQVFCATLTILWWGCHGHGDAGSEANAATQNLVVQTLGAEELGDALLQAILGSSEGIVINTPDQAVSYVGNVLASGIYSNGPFELPDGAILTTGSASAASQVVINAPNTTTNWNGPGHALCNDLVASSTHDAVVLTVSFELEDGYDGVSFVSVFGSEEYPEYVTSIFNDVFAVFLDDNPTPIIEMSVQSSFFDLGSVVEYPNHQMQYDGSSVALQTAAQVAPGPHTLRFVICDVGDSAYDSGALITALAGCTGNCTGTGPWSPGGGDSGSDNEPGNGNGSGNGNGNGPGNPHGNGCPPPGHADTAPDAEGKIYFTYDRAAAVSAAHALALRSPDEVQGVPSLPYYSAFFMSLALRAGGLPMVQTDGSDSEGEPTGWWAELRGMGSQGTLFGNNVWRNHTINQPTNPTSDGGVVGYIAGSQVGNLPNDNEREFYYLSHPAGGQVETLSRTFLVEDDGVFHTANLRTLPSWVREFDPGDYVYIDSLADTDYVTHGFMLVGYERPISCRNEYLDRVRLSRCGSRVNCAEPSLTLDLENNDDGIADFGADNGYMADALIRVPYVVDWNDGYQTQTPRPFYCSASRSSQNAAGQFSFFNHTAWWFVRAPFSGWIHQNVYVTPNFTVTRNGTIHRCPNATGAHP